MNMSDIDNGDIDNGDIDNWKDYRDKTEKGM